MTNETLIEELLKLDARLERLILARDETLAYVRETRRLVEKERKKFREQTLVDELKRLRRDAAE